VLIRLIFKISFFLLLSFLTVYSQDAVKQSQYLTDNQEELMMKVHIWGQVKNPGEKLVPYETTVLELISKAGGPGDYANLSKVRITRESESWHFTEESLKKIVSESQEGNITEDNLEASLKTHFANRILEYNISQYLDNNETLNPPPVLLPGDVVTIPTNAWSKWREAVRVSHEVAIITSIYVWYLRSK
jgi:protein involved in polysaccharide export with SLBB domain